MKILSFNHLVPIAHKIDSALFQNCHLSSVISSSRRHSIGINVSRNLVAHEP